ncbi:MAG: VTC domain-containing protein [Benjaminiella poitrasii]|nr:MAG: VTC domain-containing protein [Benjaminiella poitrasii]
MKYGQELQQSIFAPWQLKTRQLDHGWTDKDEQDFITLLDNELSKQKFIARLREKPLDKQRFDVAIVYISALHDICRNRGKQSPGNSASGGDQNAFERATAKYWIHPDNITEVKAIIMLHLPVLIFNKDKKWEPSDSAISSTYFDNSNFDLDEEAEAIRFRWYGPMNSNSVFIERKTHHASWLDGASVKDRFRIKESQVNQFMTGICTADQISDEQKKAGVSDSTVESVRFIARGVQKSFRERRLEPMIRVFYNRTAFQLPDDQRLRISLDTDLTFMREDHLDGMHRRQPTYNWRRNDVGIDYPFHYMRDNDILRFPYAVLETKLQTHLGQQPPTWLTSLIESHLVHEVPRFSKYLHGACHFYRERLPLLPWWLAELNVDIRKPREENIGLTRSRSFKPLIDGKYRRAMIEEKERANQQAVVSGSSRGSGSERISTRSSSSGTAVTQDLNSSSSFTDDLKVTGDEFDVHTTTTKRQKVKVRVEPKVFFANERTFISWLQFCALLLTVALNLLNFGDTISRTVGGIFIGLSAGIAIYALYRFEKRAWMISRRIDGRYDDIWGPAVNFYLRFR